LEGGKEFLHRKVTLVNANLHSIQEKLTQKQSEYQMINEAFQRRVQMAMAQQQAQQQK